MELVLVGLVLVAIPLLLPLGLWVALYRTRNRIFYIEQALDEQKRTIGHLSEAVSQLRAAVAHVPRADVERAPVEAPRAPAAAPARPGSSPAGGPTALPAVIPNAAEAARPIGPRPEARPAVPSTIEPSPAVVRPPAPAPAAAATAPQPPAQPATIVPARARAERPATPSRTPAVPPTTLAASAPAIPHPSVPAQRPPVVPPPPRGTAAAPPSPPSPPPPPTNAATSSFDWESLVGVKLFSAIAGIALVFAAVFFLRHSIQQGWLQPPVRVLIGTAVAIALLVLCELKAARKYPATANALDAAAIAILFATFFAAHALWDLIPAPLTFALLAAVTALAVALAIRRESLIIAVLGLLGGFSTPALLSTGENRPVPLFAYLVLLNVGLAWVAYRQVWPVLTILSLAFTTIYQWVWVYRFLNASDLSLAMGIFAIFPVLSIGALLLGRRGRVRAPGAEDEAFERTAVVAAALPLLFVAYLATVPAYGAHPGLLFGFLLLVDLGLTAVALVLRRGTLHGVAAVATLLVWAVWLTSSYDPQSRLLALGLAASFVVLYLFAPAAASWAGRGRHDLPEAAAYAAPSLLFVFPVVAGIDPGSAEPFPLFAPLFGLVLLCAWRAYQASTGGLFFIASFLAVAAQAAWSARHLDIERLPAAVVVYAAFGIMSAAIPVVARRLGRAFEPAAGAALVLLASLGLLLFLSRGPIAPEALWALALLLAILNAGMFVESASSGVPALSRVGTVLSWLVLGIWWSETAAVVGVLPSLSVVTGMTLITLAGHAWASRSASSTGRAEAGAVEFGRGVFLGLIGHAFVLFVAANREWSLPPWPVFGALAVVVLAASVTSLAARSPVLHAASTGAAALVLITWTQRVSDLQWSVSGLAASAALSLYALGWILVARRLAADEWARRGAAIALFGSELTAIVAAAGTAAPFVLVLALHVANILILLVLTAGSGWSRVAAGAAAVAWLALLQEQLDPRLATDWRQLLVLAGALYAVFTAYAVIAGPRRQSRREPWLVAIAAAAMTFFAARDAFQAGGLEWMIGIIPVILAAVTAGLLRTLLRMEASGSRDLARLALVAGAALAFLTVAIPLQLEHQWVTIGWALEAAALAWLYGRVPHRGLLLACTALFAAVFVRLALNPAIWTYEPRGALRIFNWYLYTYLLAAAALFAGAWFLSRTSDRPSPALPRLSHVLPAAAVILLFLLLNIEIADYYATGPEIAFRFGVTVSQDLTYTIGWLGFGMLLLIAGISAHNPPARIAAVALISVTTLKCFLYDLRSLEGLYRVGSFVGLAAALAVVSLILQKYVLSKPREDV